MNGISRIFCTFAFGLRKLNARHTEEKKRIAYLANENVGKSSQAVLVMLGVYNKLGFSKQECTLILERKTGRKLNEL